MCADASRMPPEISVVMGVCNDAGTLRAALASVLSQEGVELEFIAVDDGSTDGSAAILDEAARLDARLKVVHKRNAGLTRALIDGCAMASAPWIARQDADDVSLPGRLRAQLDRARQAAAPVLVGCGARCVSPAGETLLEVLPPADGPAATRRVLEEGQAISPHGTVLFDRAAYERIGGYRPEFYYAQDVDLMMRLAETGPVAAVPDVRYEFRYSPAAISGRHHRCQRAFYRLILRGHQLRARGRSDAPVLAAAARLRQRCLRKQAGKGSPFEGLFFMGSCLLERQPDRAQDYFRRARALRPWSAKAWIRWRQAVRRSRAGGRP